MLSRQSLLLLLALVGNLFCLGVAKGIRVTEIIVPKMIVAGGTADLECRWREDGAKFYSVKWYQAVQEFYRYTPTAPNQPQIFNTPTLDVDVKKSIGGHVVIANVTLEASGPFLCEVSEDEPNFHTDWLRANLSVVDLPDTRPIITGVKRPYLPGDWVDITCTSKRSKPPPELSFTINNEPAQAGWIEPQVNYTNSKGLSDSVLRMRLPLLPKILKGVGYAKVKCSSAIADIYREESFDVLTTISPFHDSVLGGAARAGSSCDADEVLCGTTNKCIQISHICNDYNDCGDWLDESFCLYWNATGCSETATALCIQDGDETCVPMADYCSSSSCSSIVDPRICVMMRERVIRQISQVVISEITTTHPLPSPNTLQMCELQGELIAKNLNKTLEDSTCPTMYTRVGDYCLSFFYTVKLSWGEAVQFCKSRGGQLVSFSGNHDMFISMLKHLRELGITADFWTGGRYVMDTKTWTWLTNSAMELGSPFWAVRYEDSCTNRQEDYSHVAQYWLNKTACYHYHQAPGANKANLCAAVTYKHYYYMTDEDCLGRRSPLCLANTNGTSLKI